MHSTYSTNSSRKLPASQVNPRWNTAGAASLRSSGSISTARLGTLTQRQRREQLSINSASFSSTSLKSNGLPPNRSTATSARSRLQTKHQQLVARNGASRIQGRSLAPSSSSLSQSIVPSTSKSSKLLRKNTTTTDATSTKEASAASGPRPLPEIQVGAFVQLKYSRGPESFGCGTVRYIGALDHDRTGRLWYGIDLQQPNGRSV